jgi:hypothetical protein
MNTAASQAILREVERNRIRNAELNWEDITANKSFLLAASLMFYKVGDMTLDKLCEDYFDIDSVPDGDAIDYNLSIAEKVLTCTNPKYQELKKRAEQVKKENTCECCEGWGYGDIGLATGENGVEKWVCRFCDVDGSNYDGWGDVECYACGDPNCVEPEDPDDARFCEDCFKENKKIDAGLDAHNLAQDIRCNPYCKSVFEDTPAFMERMRIIVQNEYGKKKNKELYEWIILNKKPTHKILKNQKKEELLNLIVLIKGKIV